jgi:hypothetical protein
MKYFLYFIKVSHFFPSEPFSLEPRTNFMNLERFYRKVITLFSPELESIFSATYDNF